MSTLKLSSIRKGMSKLRRLGHETDTFTVLGIEFQIRTITRHELTIANERAQPLFEQAQESDDSYTLANWLKTVQLGVLSFAIMRIDDMDFNGQEYILDDTDPADPETVEKSLFVHTLLDEWEDSLISVLYRKFQELTQQAEEKATKGVKFLSESPEEELEELEEQVATLRNKLGLPPLVPATQARFSEPVRAESTPQEAPPADVDVRELKTQMLQPVPQDALQQPPVVERDGYHYELPQEQVPPTASEPSQDDEVQREHERLYQERQERQRGREPLNQAPIQVYSEPSPQDSPVRTANAPQQMTDAQYIPNPNGATLLSPATQQQETQQGPAFKANQKPSGKGNPNFYNPNRRQ
jgi:hypothetical protein